jgi:hypothetical protein
VRSQRKERNPFDEREFLNFARSYLSKAFPNPERTGCPPDEALKLLAIRPMQTDESVVEHLGCCSPCFMEYMTSLARAKAEIGQRQAIRSSVWSRRFVIAFGVAAILVIAPYLFITTRRTEPIVALRAPVPITAPGNQAQTETAMYVPAVIDLSNAAPTRGTEQGTAGAVSQIIPWGPPLDLTLRLPLGSEERLYSIALLSLGEIVWSESARARRQSGDTVLRLRADFSHVPAGEYDLQVASAGRRLTVPVLIKHVLPKNAEPKP